MGTIAFLQNLQTGEILIIVVVALLIFGSKLPEMARKLGKGVQEFRKGLNEASSEVKREHDAAVAEAEERKGQSQAGMGTAKPGAETPTQKALFDAPPEAHEKLNEESGEVVSPLAGDPGTRDSYPDPHPPASDNATALPSSSPSPKAHNKSSMAKGGDSSPVVSPEASVN